MSSFDNLDDDDLWRRVDLVLGTIPNEENRATVRRYLKERLANGVRPSTIGQDANALRGFCVHLKAKRLEDVKRDDVVDYVTQAYAQRKWRNRNKKGEEKITTKKVRIGPATLAVRKVIIRAFMRWLRGTDEYPEEVRRLKINAPSAEEMPTDQLIEREDLVAMLRVHESPRHKAILAVLHESGLRAGEFSSLHIGSVTFDKFGCVLILPRKTDGARTRGLKTGTRRIRLFEATPYLQAWYEAHPLKNNPKAPLFFSDSRRAPQARMTPGALWKFCNDAGKKAKLPKDIHPHLFRHSAATERARRGWNEPRMRAFFGWSKNSDMPARYTHLAGQDHEKADLEDRGLLDPKERVKPTLSPVLCPVCKTANLAAAMFCQACRAPIAPEAEEELERRRQEEIREAAARVVAQFFPDRVPPEIKRLLDTQDEKGHA